MKLKYLFLFNILYAFDYVKLGTGLGAGLLVTGLLVTGLVFKGYNKSKDNNRLSNNKMNQIKTEINNEKENIQNNKSPLKENLNTKYPNNNINNTISWINKFIQALDKQDIFNIVNNYYALLADIINLIENIRKITSYENHKTSQELFRVYN